MYSVEKFEIDVMNGVMLEEILEEVGEFNFLEVMKEYVKVVDWDNKEEYLFYEEEDIKVLKRFNFNNLMW